LNIYKEADVIDRRMTRRELCAVLAAASAVRAAGASGAQTEGHDMTTRRIGSSQESVPVIGMGSSNTFDVGESSGDRAPLREVLQIFARNGGAVIDTSPMYGRAESVLGDLIDELKLRPKFWIATKVWTRGKAEGQRQIETSMRRLRTSTLELVQIHNLLDWRKHVPTLRKLKEDGKIRYTGITHYRADAHDALMQVLGAERFDWVQFNYSLGEREAEGRLLPFCAERKIAVLANRPFADGGLFDKTRGKPLPPWAAEIGCQSWAQFFLRFVCAHPAVTCAIPATADPRHMTDNVEAGRAPLPDGRQRERMAAYFNSL
jgi:aryl-alcohol dehydrogenase-like predicted oxidoreductase